MMNTNDVVTFYPSVSRRSFIKALGIGAGAVVFSGIFQSCASFDPKKDYSKKPDEFNIKAFDSWFKSNFLYTPVNPNLRSPHGPGYFPTFERMIYSFNNASPGIDFDVPMGETIVASAPGWVVEVKKLNTGRLGGYMVTIIHPGDYRSQFKTYYAHLDSDKLAKVGPIERGQSVGKMTLYPEHTKMMFRVGVDWVNQDRYGPGMGFMVYPQDYDYSKDPPLEVLSDEKKLSDHFYDIKVFSRKQQEAINEIEQHKKDYGKARLIDNFHVKGTFDKHRDCRWSPPEIMLYLRTLYEINPGYFPGLDKGDFNKYVAQFYSNQPVTLTLPFMKR